jgi:hypothetical protein
VCNSPPSSNKTRSSSSKREARRANAKLVEQNAKLADRVAKLNERVAELLAGAQRKQRRPVADKPAAAMGAPPLLDGGAQQSFTERPKAPEKPAVIGGSRRCRRKRHRGSSSRYRCTD